MAIIQCYAPTNEASEEVTGEFYQTLNDITTKVNKHDMIRVTGKMNAMVGSDNVGYEDVMGKTGMVLSMRTENRFGIIVRLTIL